VTLSAGVAAWVLLSALLHASWNVLIKRSPDRLLDTAALALAASLLCAATLPFLPLPAPESRPLLAGSIVIHVFYFLALVETYRWADLSSAYPMMRGGAPVLVALALTALGEPPSWALAAGIALVSGGIMLPAWAGIARGAVAVRGVAMALGMSAIIALYTLVDAEGARRSGNALAYNQWLFFFDAFGILAIAAWRRRGRVLAHLRGRWPQAFAGGLLTVGSYGIVIWAMTRAPVAAVAALREISVVFAALAGTLLLKEPMGRWRIAGALAVAAGAIVIKLGS
jgi:drug/metabolite transporter (DMT)-like permease